MRESTVLLADDHVVFMEGIVRILADRFEVVGTVSDGGLLVDAAARLRPDVIVADISMRSMSGFEALRQLKARQIDSRVIFLTMYADPLLAAEAFKLGAKGFVLKQSSAGELVEAIEAVLAGHDYISAALTDDVLVLMAEAPAAGMHQLTTRQKEVLQLIVNGHRIKEIASHLKLSPRTVETIKYEMMRDLRVQSTPALVRYAMDHRLVGF
jgi:DNA-binding NarL/FixJ family response regulator